MTLTSSRERVFEQVRTTLVDALSVSAEQVTPESRIILDLGAESIDLLDLRFRIEKAFQIRVTRDDLVAVCGIPITAADYQQRFTVAVLCRYVEGRLERANG